MNTAAIITLIICGSVVVLIGPILTAFFAVYWFHRGSTRQNPVPSIIEKVINPPPKMVEEKTYPAPVQPCSHCHNGPKWELGKDKSIWKCLLCGFNIAGPEPRTRS